MRQTTHHPRPPIQRHVSHHPSARRRLRAGAAAVSAAMIGFTTLGPALGWTDAKGAASLAAIPATPMAPGTLLVEAEAGPASHLVISELATGGGSASDEFMEIYNPSSEALPLEGLEVVYVTASGATVTRKASWDAGAPEMGPGSHLLIANESGLYAGIADATYAAGLSATGGSLAIRIIGAASAVDAVGWGSAASVWMEGEPAPAPAAGHSLERLPGGAAGSGQDTDQNAVDFVERTIMDPQNLASAPTPTTSSSPSPAETPLPTSSVLPSDSPSPTPTATPNPTGGPTPTPATVLSISQARAAPDGTLVTIEGGSLTASDFADGGGYLDDGTGGIAVLVTDGAFARRAALRVSGTLDDRYHQRTLRVSGSDITVLGSSTDPQPITLDTGAAGEASEDRLIEVSGTVLGAPTQLSAGPAFDVDDGSGPLRVVVATATGIDVDGWQTGAVVRLRGVLGQRDSTSLGNAGYRLQPRDAADVLSVTPPGASGSPSASASGSPSPGVSSISAARSAAIGSSVTVEGTVTMAPGFIDPDSAVIADDSAAILLRLPDDFKSLKVGDRVRATGARSTKSGMETIRLSDPPTGLGRASKDPEPARVATGGVGEERESQLLVVRGAIATSPRRSSAQNVYFDLDDGSGPLRIYISPRSGISTETWVTGTWVELIGVLAQETTGKQPERGYRLWPRSMADVAQVAAGGGTGSAGSTSATEGTVAHPGAAGIPGVVGGQSGTSMPVPVRGLVPPRLAVALAAPSVVQASLPAPAGPAPADQRAILALTLACAAVLLLSAGWLLAGPRLLALVQARQEPEASELPPAAPAATALSLLPVEVLDGNARQPQPLTGSPRPGERA